MPSAQPLLTPTAAATCNTQILKKLPQGGETKNDFGDLNKTLEHQLYVRSSINIKFITFAKERRKKTVTGNLSVLRFRLQQSGAICWPLTTNYTLKQCKKITPSSRMEKAKGQ